MPVGILPFPFDGDDFVISDLFTVVKTGQITLLMLLLLPQDISSAFDTVDHDILTKRMRLTYGVLDTALNVNYVIVFRMRRNSKHRNLCIITAN